MKTKSRKFGDLLTEGIYAVQRAESHSKKKNLDDIQEELGEAIKRQASTIEWYRKGNVPTSQFEIEQLARELFKLGSMSAEWLENFLKSAKHNNWIALRDELCIPGTNTPEHDDIFLYKRTKLYLHKQVRLDGSAVCLRQTEVQVTGDTPLSVIRQRMINLPTSMGQFQLNFLQGYREDDGSINAYVLATHDHLCVWAIEFDPPLLKGQKASYSYETFGHLYSSNSVEIEQQFKEGRRSQNFESWSVKMTAPTDELEMKISFPMNFPITLPSSGGFSVSVGVHEQNNERTLILNRNGFMARYDEKFRQWTMALHVSPAHFDHVYELKWLPP